MVTLLSFLPANSLTVFHYTGMRCRKNQGEYWGWQFLGAYGRVKMMIVVKGNSTARLGKGFGAKCSDQYTKDGLER